MSKMVKINTTIFDLIKTSRKRNKISVNSALYKKYLLEEEREK
jgi:hypothetical protein